MCWKTNHKKIIAPNYDKIKCAERLSRGLWRSAPRGSAPRGLCVVSWLPSPCPCGLELAALSREVFNRRAGAVEKNLAKYRFCEVFWDSGGGGSGRQPCNTRVIHVLHAYYKVLRDFLRQARPPSRHGRQGGHQVLRDFFVVKKFSTVENF